MYSRLEQIKTTNSSETTKVITQIPKPLNDLKKNAFKVATAYLSETLMVINCQFILELLMQEKYTF